MKTDLIVKTESGLVEGIYSADKKCRIFKGVPYAQPPVGNLRFAPPQSKKGWIGVRPVKTFAPKAFQEDITREGFYAKEFYSGEPEHMSEDCLYLNIWTPTEKTEEKLPVLMWIHGGALMHGSGAEVEFDGEGFARKGVILVTVNYRVGALGFFCHPDLEKENPQGISGNYGILDQIAALDWIYCNIENFGGDKNRITVAGQSAGCMSAQLMASSPLTKGKMRGAILQSGGGIPGFWSEMKKETQQEVSQKLMKHLGAKTIADMRRLSPEAISYGAYEINDSDGMIWLPVIDGKVIPAHPVQAATEGMIHKIPYMIGSTKNEMGAEIACTLAESAVNFAINNSRLDMPDVYVYRFDRELPGDNAGAFHSAELWYEFETLSRCWRPFEQKDYQTAQRFSTAIAEFVATNKAGSDWQRCTEENRFVKHFD